MEYNGYLLKEGSMCFIAPETAHRIPEVFSNPDQYDPERFSPDRKEGDNKLSLLGFGGGAHRCAGVNFAKLEIKIIIAKMFQNYDIELLDKNPKPRPGLETKYPESPCRIHYQKRQCHTKV